MIMLKEIVIDYESNKKDIDKWTTLKGEKKYIELSTILRDINTEITWRKLDDLFRYDKRLLFNCFKYISMFEDFIRACLLNETNATYDDLKENYFIQMMKKIVDDKANYTNYLDVNILEKEYKNINDIRKNICHNKLILKIDNLRKKLYDFMMLLPDDYKENFRRAKG